MTKELRFLFDQEHYKRDRGWVVDARENQVKGNQLLSLHRHKTSKISNSELFIECEPVDRHPQGQMLAEIGQGFLEAELYDPVKQWQEIFDTVVSGAHAARAWAFKVEFDPSVSAEGEILPRDVDPRRFFPCPPFRNIHDMRCPWVCEERRMSIRDIRAMKEFGWENTELVRPDDDPLQDQGAQMGQDFSGNTEINKGTMAPTPGGEPKGNATVIFVYFRTDPWKKTQEAVVSMQALQPQERYHACIGDDTGAGCDYAEQPPNNDGSQLEPIGPQCPTCGKQMQRVDAHQETQTVPTHQAGVVYIIAPKSKVDLIPGGGDWSTRSFPYGFYCAYPHPTRLIGNSETSIYRSLQVASNTIVQAGVHQYRLNVDRVFLLKGAFEDENQQPYNLSDDPNKVGYATSAAAIQGGIHHVQGSGVSPGFNLIHGAIEGLYRQDMGMADFGPSSERSRNIAVGTTEAMISDSEVPIEQHVRNWRRSVEIQMGNVLDLQIQHYTNERAIKVRGPNGASELQVLKASGLPYMNVRVSATPSLKKIDVEKLKVLSEWASMPPELQPVAAKYLNISPSDVAEIQKNKGGPQPSMPIDALIQALAALIKGAPGSIAENQIQAALQMAGLPPPQGPSVLEAENVQTPLPGEPGGPPDPIGQQIAALGQAA